MGQALTALLRLPQVPACVAWQHPNSRQEAGLDHPGSCRPSTEKLVLFTAWIPCWIYHWLLFL